MVLLYCMITKNHCKTLSFKVTQITFHLKLQCDQVEIYLIYVTGPAKTGHVG